MGKECWQLRNLKKPTFCFQKAGNSPCSATSCSVEKHIQELESEGIKIDDWWLWILPHTACRTGSLLADNVVEKNKISV